MMNNKATEWRKQIGNRIRDKRIELGRELGSMANLCGVTPQRMSYIEVHGPGTFRLLFKIATALKMNPKDLLP